MVSGLGFRVWGGVRVWGLGFRELCQGTNKMEVRNMVVSLNGDPNITPKYYDPFYGDP